MKQLNLSEYSRDELRAQFQLFEFVILDPGPYAERLKHLGEALEEWSGCNPNPLGVKLDDIDWLFLQMADGVHCLIRHRTTGKFTLSAIRFWTRGIPYWAVVTEIGNLAR